MDEDAAESGSRKDPPKRLLKSRSAKATLTGFFYERPVGRTHLRVKVPYEPGRGNR